MCVFVFFCRFQNFNTTAWKQQLPSRSFATNPNNKSSRRNSNSHNKHQKKQQKVDQDSAQGEEARRIDERARSNLRNIVFGSAAGVAVALGMVLVENWDNWFGSGSGNVAQAQEASQQPAPSPAQLRRMIQQAQQALEDMRQYLTEIPEDSEWYAVAAKWVSPPSICLFLMLLTLHSFRWGNTVQSVPMPHAVPNQSIVRI